MPTIAYLANQFPSSVEPYVGEEIEELRRRGAQVIAGSVRTTEAQSTDTSAGDVLCIQPVRFLTIVRALGLMATRWRQVWHFVQRAVLQGRESPSRRVKALLHTWLGAYYAVLLRERKVDHIHVHHGYFGSWIAMVAARLLDTGYSLTLHGSDLLIHDAYLDTKLGNCRFCITISEYNRNYILKRFPAVDPRTIFVSRLGVDEPRSRGFSPPQFRRRDHRFTLLSAGRLHAVKNHAFLVRACAQLREAGVDFQCAIAGAGPEQEHLDALIHAHRLQDRLTLLGHVPHAQMQSLYESADLFVLTSISEGIPLVLMEAMARGTLVLAPAITGIPELVVPGKTGFLYQAGNSADFVQRIVFLVSVMRSANHPPWNRLNWIRHAGRAQVRHNFNRENNLARFGSTFLQLLAPQPVEHFSS